MEYKFNKKQQNILKRAFGYKTFTEKLYNKVNTVKITTLNKRLNTIGYRLKLTLKGK